MEEYNPYAPPIAAAAGPGMSNSRGWRLEGDVLVVDKGATLPNRCLYDGSPVSGAPAQKTLTWVPPWVSILVISPIIFLIVYLIVKKSGPLAYYLSDEAKRRRTSGVLLIVGSMVVLFVGMFAAGAADEPVLMLLGFVAFFALLIFGVIRTRIFTLKRIDESSIHIKLREPAVRAFASSIG
jgi:hypothetical protein